MEAEENPDMLDPITCEGCGCQTYAQMARCPQCGRAIAVPHAKLNLPPEFVYEDEAGVWIYPAKLAAARLNLAWFVVGSLILTGGLFALGSFVSGTAWAPGALIVFLLGILLGAPIVFQTLYATFRLFGTLPVFYMGAEGMAFPYVSSTLLPWENIRNVDVLEIGQKLLRYRALKLDLETPMKMVFASMARLLVRGPQQSIAVPIVSGWPVSAEDVRDLVLLGLETWARNREKASAGPARPPAHPEQAFDRTIRQAQGFAVIALLLPLVFVIILILA